MKLEKNSIYMVDNFLNSEEVDFLEKYFRGDVWGFGHCTDHEDERLYKGRWFCSYLKDKKYFREHLLEKIERATGHKWEPVEIYANGQTILNGSDWHVDWPIHEDNPVYFTALIYISDINKSNIDVINGHFEFKINDKIRSIEPFKNRMILFDSGILHRGNAPTIPGFLRISIAWKLKKIA